MKELTLNETQAVSGGLGNFGWMLAGYVFGKVMDGMLTDDWGSAENDDIFTAP